jgi:Ca2+-transporting ATPase
MGPMCSIVYENEPAEKNGMQQMPRQLGSTFFIIQKKWQLVLFKDLL